jgi:hypothetical protein
MSERYLSDNELTTLTDEPVYDGDYWDRYRAIATAASDKAVAWVIEEMEADKPKPCMCGHDTFSEGQIAALDRMIRFLRLGKWLRENGLPE